MFSIHELFDAHYHHALYYLKRLQVMEQLYRKGGAQVTRALTLFEQEWPQIDQAQSWAASCQEQDQAARLCSDFCLSGADLLAARRAVRDRIRWLEAAQTAAHRLKQWVAEGEHCSALGRAYWQAGQIERAVSTLERALAVAQIVQGDAIKARAHRALGEIAASQSAYAEAHQHGMISQALFEALDDPRGIADTVAMLGNLALLQDDYPTAEAHFYRSLALYRALGDRAGEAHVLARQGSLAGTQRQFALAGERFAESHAIYAALKHQEGIGQTANMLGTIASCMGHFAQAEAWYQQSLDVYSRTGHHEGIAAAYLKLGEIDQYTGQLDRARTHFGRALELYDAMHNVYHVAGVLFRLGNVALTDGDYADAQQQFERCVAFCQEVNRPLLASALSGLAQVASQQGRYPDAQQYFEQGLAVAHENGDHWIMADLHQEYGNLALKLGDFRAARHHLLQALDLAAAMQAVPLVLSILGSMAYALADAQQSALALEAAITVHEHPSSLQFDRDHVSGLLVGLRGQLAPDAVAIIEAQACAGDLDALVQRVRLAENARL